MPARDERHRLGGECGFAMRIAAMTKMSLNTEAEKPTYSRYWVSRGPECPQQWTQHAGLPIHGQGGMR